MHTMADEECNAFVYNVVLSKLFVGRMSRDVSFISAFFSWIDVLKG